MAQVQWNDSAPIYRQLKERVIAMMLDGVLKPGDALPSVRQVAAEYQLNPITVSRAYQELADEALVEKRRGLGMYVTEEAPVQRARPVAHRGMAARARAHPAPRPGHAGPARAAQGRQPMNAVDTRSAVVSARGLRKAYRNKLALDGASFDIAPGRIVG